VTGRASVFSDDRIVGLLRDRFVAVTDNCSHTQRQTDAKGGFFRKVAEQGHYAGRTNPTSTRQGLYTCTVEGDLLASVNTTNADRMLAMLEEALTAWEDHVPREASAPAAYSADPRYERAFPEGGLILRGTMRDLPRDDDPDANTAPHNFDYMWITADEADGFIPGNLAVGVEFNAPAAVVQRLARFHLVDHVRGESTPWRAEDVGSARITLRIEEADGERVRLALSGHARLSRAASGETHPESGQPYDTDRGVDVELSGSVDVNGTTRAVTGLRAIATGDRWGSTRYNGRSKDLGPAPIGFGFELLPDAPENRTPPKFVLGSYFAE
jgi:hypothetical protein